MRLRGLASFVLITLLAASFGQPVSGRTLPATYPRIANYYLTRTISPIEANELARWDIVILGLDNQYTNPEIFSLLRKKNPDIIILAYVLSEEFPSGYESMTDPNYPLVKLRSGIADSWWLRDSAGAQTGFWPGAKMINVTDNAPLANGERWNTYLPNFVQYNVLSTKLWDGVFFDNVFNDVSWVNGGNIDTNNDHVADLPAMADAAWRDGMATIMSTMRKLAGPNTVILGNGGGLYYPDMSGRLIEEFPSTLDGGWSGAMKKYVDVMNKGLSPSIVIVNGKTSDGLPTDYQTMRYVLASTLMDNGFFSFDRGSVQHAALWHYDEFDAYLGDPLGAARRVWPSKSTSYQTGVWRRDFTNGIVLVNSSDSPQTIKLGDGFEELRGAPPSVNGGRVVTQVTLPGHDGRILLKRQMVVDAGAYTNGALVQIFKPDGTATRSGFFSYTGAYPGGTPLLQRDLNHDGHAETITTGNGRVTVVNYRQETIGSFKPFGASYTGGISVAAGDLNGDGVEDLVMAPQRGANQRIVGTTYTGRRLIGPWRPFKRDYTGGPSVAVSDVNGDGRIEIIAGAGKGADPRVSVFTTRGKRLSSFLAYTRTFRGGIRVAAGDVQVGGQNEIVTVPGPGGGPQVRIFTSRGRSIGPGFFALQKSYRGGLEVSVDDVDHTGTERIIVSTPYVY